MPDEYLWDGTGERDPEVARLEELLGRYRYPVKRKYFRHPKPMWMGVAAVLLLGIGLTFELNRKPQSMWQMAGTMVAVGQTIQTGSRGGAKLEAAAFGEVELDANSQLQVLAARAGHERMVLRAGTMHALIWAPPSRFVVDTPSAKTIDLGCSYTLSVLRDGSGILTVQAGWVAFQDGSRESFIPAGAACRTRPRLGPGLPYFEDASQGFRDAVANFDSTGGREGLREIVNEARKEDALTLWHLIQRTQGRDRDGVIERFASLIPGMNSSGLREGNSAALDRAWNSLGLGGAEWWRMWKRDWRK